MICFSKNLLDKIESLGKMRKILKDWGRPRPLWLANCEREARRRRFAPLAFWPFRLRIKLKSRFARIITLKGNQRFVTIVLFRSFFIDVINATVRTAYTWQVLILFDVKTLTQLRKAPIKRQADVLTRRFLACRTGKVANVIGPRGTLARLLYDE